MIRVLICDDQDMVREGLRAILSTVPEIKVVGVAVDGVQAVEMVNAHYLATFPKVCGLQQIAENRCIANLREGHSNCAVTSRNAAVSGCSG